MTKTVTPRIWVEDGWVKCKTPYSETITPRFAAALKESINWKLRQWSPSEKLWMVDPSCLDELIAVAQKFFPNLVIKRGQDRPAEQKQDHDNGTYWTIANLLRVASPDALKRVYRALAADLHTDHGGDMETMKRLNVAWDKIRQERGIR